MFSFCNDNRKYNQVNYHIIIVLSTRLHWSNKAYHQHYHYRKFIHFKSITSVRINITSMNQEQVDELIRNINRLQISLNRTQAELDQVRNQIGNQNAEDPQPAQARVPREEFNGLSVGDSVRILNRVRLSGSARYSQGVQGVINRFGSSYVFVRVSLPSRNNVDRYQDIRRAPHNIERLNINQQ